MGIIEFFRRRRETADAERMLEYGVFLLNLKSRLQEFGVPIDAPLKVRIAFLLYFGSNLAREGAGFAAADLATDLREAAALILIQQQGIHTLLSLAHGPNKANSAAYRDEFRDIFTFSTAQVFGFDFEKPNDAALGLLSFAASTVRQAQKENTQLLQSAFNAWDAFLADGKNVDQLTNVYRQAVTWIKAGSDG